MNWSTQSLIFFINIIYLARVNSSSRILAYFPSPVKSHLLIHCAVADTLAQAGHNVTVLANAPNVYKSAKYKYMQINELNYEETEPQVEQQSVFKRIREIFNQFNHDLSILHPRMQSFLQAYQAGSFDLLILGYYMNDFHLGLAAHFQCPVIISVTVQSTPSTNSLVGNPPEIAYVPSLFLRFKQPMTFMHRVINLLSFGFEIIFGVIFEYYQNQYYNLNFPPDRYASYEVARQNVSLVFSNHHFSQGPMRPYVPALVEIGGIQINDTQTPLPTDLANILNNCTEGFIYVSFGTKIKPSAMTADRKKMMFDVFAKLPYTVLWKYDNSQVPGVAKNVHYRSWLPQNDILAHPHVKLFITHGGQGSIVEAQYHGVPMVAIPFMSDQPSNVRNMVNSGYGLGLEYEHMSTVELKKVILEVLKNPKYRDRVKRLSFVYRDRPMTPRQLVLYWVNYVLRHNGAYHLKSPALLLNNWQLMSLDVLLFVVLMLIIVISLLRLACNILYQCYTKRSNNQVYTLYERNNKKKI